MSSSLNNLALLRPGIRTKRVSSYDLSGSSDLEPISVDETNTRADIDKPSGLC